MASLIFAQYFHVINAFYNFNEFLFLTVVSLRTKLIVFSCFLIVLGAIFYFCGDSLASDLLNSRELISGVYFVVFGIFLAIAGFLVLVSQIFRGNSIVF